jgi:hypothetical protein
MICSLQLFTRAVRTGKKKTLDSPNRMLLSQDCDIYYQQDSDQDENRNEDFSTGGIRCRLSDNLIAFFYVI